MAAELTVIFQDVQYTTHLREDKAARTLGLHRFQKFIQYNHFACILDEVFVSGKWWSRFLALSLELQREHTTVRTAPSKTTMISSANSTWTRNTDDKDDCSTSAAA